MNRTDLDSNRAFRGAVTAVIVAAVLNGTAGAAQALAGSEGTTDSITGTAEPADARTGPAETATATTGQAEAVTVPDQTAPAVSAGAPAPLTPSHTANASSSGSASHTANAPSSGSAEDATAASRLDTITAIAVALSRAPATPSRPDASWTRARPPGTGSAQAPRGRPIWTRTGLGVVAGGLSGATKARAPITRSAKAKAAGAKTARKITYPVHRRVWRTSARPHVRVWAPTTPKGRNKAIAYRLVTQRSWPVTQFRCLDSLWTRESNWNHRAQNPSSGAYGIPQALPGTKMVGVGNDWRVNPATQIRWGLAYIKGRYGSPCGAWGHFQSHNWY
jgi:hypothetical protein